MASQNDFSALPVKLSWSGGKDSTASVILHYLSARPAFAVSYIPMLNADIPMIRKNHFEFLHSAAERFSSEFGIPVYFVSGKTYLECCDIYTTEKASCGVRRRGYASGGGCFCVFRDMSKIKALERFKMPFSYQDIGICIDEVKRLRQLSEKKRSILVEKGYTERDAFLLCTRYSLLSPHYSNGVRRDGCAICPNAKRRELIEWLRDYPEAESVLLEIDEKARQEGFIQYPYRNGMTFEERIRGCFSGQLSFGF